MNITVDEVASPSERPSETLFEKIENISFLPSFCSVSLCNVEDRRSRVRENANREANENVV